MTTIAKKPEILAPAGNPEKLRYALAYGADAVYCGLDRFGMRAAADNFDFEPLDAAVKYAHSLNKKVYLTMNTMPKDGQFSALPAYLEQLATIKPDAFIVADPGVFTMVKEKIPDAAIHISTQVNTLNAASCRFWHSLGAERVVLARELSLEDIRRIRDSVPPELELECFVHGAMCVSYSGRCLLSNYYTGRDANNGACTQPCRWKYHLYEEKRPDKVLTAEQTDEGTFLFSSRDTCMLEYIPQLVDAGIDSFKIEGRMKSAYYTAAVTNAYRLALDDYFDDPQGYKLDPRYLAEVQSVGHREYGTGYYFNHPAEEANIAGNTSTIREKAFLCTVSEFCSDKKLARCFQRNKLTVGDAANLLSPGATGRPITIGKLYDLDMNPIDSTPHPQMEFYLEINSAKPGDIIRAE